MKKCPNCGYERRPIDDEFTNAPANACPKCFSFYDSVLPPGDASDDLEKPARKTDPALFRTSLKRTRTSTYWLAAAFGFLALVYFTSVEEPSSLPQKSVQPGPVSVSADRDAGNGRAAMSISEIAGLIGPSVVAVIVYNDKGEAVSRASGFFTGPGHVLTNHHAFRELRKAEIKTSSGRIYPVNTVVAEDRLNDLIMVSTTVPQGEFTPLQIVSETPQVGEKIVVIGNPLGLDHTVSDGIVSAFREKDGRKMIQITAPISPGSSGSPVVNMKGEVIGVAFMQLIGGQNLNFCIPGEIASRLGPGSAFIRTDFRAYVPDKLYCFIDEHKTLRFVKNPENAPAHYMLLTGPDGAPDRERFEKWVFEILGGNPYKIDPRAEVEKERSRLPEHFRKLFPGHEIDHLSRFAPEARAYWGSWIANRFQSVFDRASRAKQEGIARHRQLMEYFDRHIRS